MNTLRAFGKGPGFIAVGAMIVLGLIALSFAEKDVAALTGPLGSFVVAFYGAGFAKVLVDRVAEVRKNGANKK